MESFFIKSLVPNLMVKSVNASLEFYESILNFKAAMTVSSKADSSVLNWAMLSHSAGANIMLHKEDNFKEEYRELNELSPGGSVILYMRVAGLKHLHQSISEKVKVVKKCHTTFYGMEEFTIQDPDGYFITFSEPVSEQ